MPSILNLGVCGITRDIKKMGSNVARLMSWAPVLESMMADYDLPLSTEALARKMGFSESRFRRHFRKKFGMSPRTYLTKVRLTAACYTMNTNMIWKSCLLAAFAIACFINPGVTAAF